MLNIYRRFPLLGWNISCLSRNLFSCRPIVSINVNINNTAINVNNLLRPFYNAWFFYDFFFNYGPALPSRVTFSCYLLTVWLKPTLTLSHNSHYTHNSHYLTIHIILTIILLMIIWYHFLFCVHDVFWFNCPRPIISFDLHFNLQIMMQINATCYKLKMRRK